MINIFLIILLAIIISLTVFELTMYGILAFSNTVRKELINDLKLYDFNELSSFISRVTIDIFIADALLLTVYLSILCSVIKFL